MFRNVYPREKYLSRIRPFFDSDIIKVITGLRRCGKSFILKGIINELLINGKSEESIVYLPLDQRGFKNIKTAEQLENRIESMIQTMVFIISLLMRFRMSRGLKVLFSLMQKKAFPYSLLVPIHTCSAMRSRQN